MKKNQRQNKAATIDRSAGKETVPLKTYNLRERKYESGQHGQGTPNMRNRRRQTAKANAREGAVVEDEAGPRKSIKSLKRKYEDEQDEVNSPTKHNFKRRRTHMRQNDQGTKRKATSSVRGRRSQPLAKRNPKEKRRKIHNEKIKASLKNSEENTTYNLVFQTKEYKRVTGSTTNNAGNSGKRVNTDTDSKLRQQIKRTRKSKKRFPKETDKSRKNKRQKTSNPQGRSLVVKKYNQKKEKEQRISNIRQSTQAERCNKSKEKINKHSLQKKKSSLVAKTQDIDASTSQTSNKDFTNLFLKKITVQLHPISGSLGEIHEISVSHDNLLWVNYLYNAVHLRDTAGKILRSFKLDARAVFSCCTPGGDLLLTQGYGGNSKPVITLLSRKGNSKVLADLSSYATYLFGILFKDERIYVVANRADSSKYFIVKLDMNGEVESVYNTENAHDSINQIIFLNDQIVAFRINAVDMLPLETGAISSVAMNKVNIRNSYSGSASTDNLGNVILGSNAQLFVINPSLEFVHKLDTGISGRLISTAVDQQNQLWFGTADGKLYSTKYLK
ncbi:uncharacterized protein LOC133181578 [Saccostrea echinata]|uniref:uncharacterized protein LOC133181578 n=1 Tax=Saccostrea echinata TaxID=191078 RepID=UPI002A80B7D2|nr:uncharacterized protein LOC133181578 [Saccostrea echinata]